jgi:predicted phosphodiesterase
MRLVVLSDVHGNLPALEAVLDDARQYSPDGFVVAGDLTGGPQANETIGLLRKLTGWIIRGNSNINLLRYESGDVPDTWRTSRQFGLLRWAHRNLSSTNLTYLQSLPDQLTVALDNTVPIRIVHGSPRNPFESIFPDTDPATLGLALAQTTEPVLICGHTHRSWKFEKDGRLALNPGAVCGALNGDIRSQFALLTWRNVHWKAEHHAVSYDHNRLRVAFKESGLLDEGGPIARSFLLSIETGRNVNLHLLNHAYRLAAEAGFKDVDVVPDLIWEQAAASFNWCEFEKGI